MHSISKTVVPQTVLGVAAILSAGIDVAARASARGPGPLGAGTLRNPVVSTQSLIAMCLAVVLPLWPSLWALA
jgi:hypothetical protein